MGKFNFEDYRQPWETGPHWELKKEFIETYQDMFEEDRLLCLAQAYSNVILMNCSYPDPVMRQISELSKPLQMRKKFQGINNSNETAASKNDQQREKIKLIYEQAGRPFKQVKFCSSKEQYKSTSPSDSTNMHQSPPEQSKSSYPLFVSSQQDTQSLSQISAIPSLNVAKDPESFLHNEDNIFLEKEKDERITSALGLPFIKSFVEMMDILQTDTKNIQQALFRVLNKLGIKDESCFKFDIDPDSPEHAKLHISKFFIKNCEIASKTASKKKEAKMLSAKAAVDTLVKLSTSYTSSAEIKSEMNSVAQYKPSIHKTTDYMKELQLFSKSIVNRIGIQNEPAICVLKTIASLLDMDDCIAFDVTSFKTSPSQTEYCCKFLLKGILISSGKANTEDEAKKISADLGLLKLSNLSEYEIHIGELKKKHSSSQLSNPFSFSQSYIETCVEKPRFILNKAMYDLSLKDGFVLIEKEKYKADVQAFSKTILYESASFNHKTYEYQFEDVHETVPPSKKAIVIIAGVVVGCGVSVLKEEAKAIACTRALSDLKKKYYTLRVKEEYVEGFIVTRNQVFDGESYSSNVISESNVGCKMLKNMGWTGGGLGGKGIAEPIQANAKSSLGTGLGFGASKERQTLQLFRKRLQAMLQEFCKSENFSDLVFSKDFTKEERKEIHQLASRMHLHTQSRGVGNERFLTVRHKYETVKLLKFLVNNGGSNSKFELIDDSGFSFQV